MSLLVVPVAADEAGLVTLAELDALLARAHVFFEVAGHPLAPRLEAAGVRCDVLGADPDPHDPNAALVCDPSSPRVLHLARLGADVTAGPARSPDALCAAHAAPGLRRSGAALATLVVIMARLRSDDGCPWDLEQSHESLTAHLLEEAYEVIEAIESDSEPEKLADELGDVLLQVAFHARIAEQEDRFGLADVADAIAVKLLHRHPHVFGDTTVAGADDVVRNWEALKAAEKGGDGPFAGLPKGLPALLAAYKTQKRATGLGWKTNPTETRARVDKALDEVDVGSALFWLVALSRGVGIDPESALLRATGRFKAGLAERGRHS